MNVQQRNLPKGGQTGYVYDGETGEAHFRTQGRGGSASNYMKIHRTQITNLPGAQTSNISNNVYNNKSPSKLPIQRALATTPQLQAIYGMRKDSPDSRNITPVQRQAYKTPAQIPVENRNQYSQLVSKMPLTERKTSKLIPPLSPNRANIMIQNGRNYNAVNTSNLAKKGLKMMAINPSSIPKSLVDRQIELKDGFSGGQTWTTRDYTPSPTNFEPSRSGSASSSRRYIFQPQDQMKTILG